MPIFADATFFVALFNKRDTHHAAAAAELARIARASGSAPPVIFTDYVFDEVLTTVLARTGRHDRAANAGQTMKTGKVARMVFVSKQTFEEAFDLFLERPDKKWSFTDCTSFRIMEAMGIDTALSFDSDFRAAGFSTVPS